MLVSDIARRNAEFFGDAEALLDLGSGRRSTWSEVDARASRFARGLAELGLGKGDRFSIFAPNCAEYVDFFFGCARSGVVGAPLNIRLAPAELAGYLRHVEPAAVLVHASLAEAADAWLADVPSVKVVVGTGAGHERAVDLEELLAAQQPEEPAVRPEPTDAYQLAATSGTSGTPKAAVMTHRNALAAMVTWMTELSIDEGGASLQTIPMFFNPGGPAGLHPVLMKGGRTVLAGGFEPGAFLRTVHEQRITASILVPTMIQMVLEHPDCRPELLESLQQVCAGGSPLSRDLLRRARQVFGDVFYPFYGMAESVSCGLVLRRRHQLTEGTEAQVRRLGSAGKPMALVRARVVGDDGRDVPHDNATPGEIHLAGETVCAEYFRMPEETALAHEGEWMKTGDIGVIDEEGFVTIVDRAKDIIITGGINVASREVEEALCDHPAVAAAAVIGVPHERWGEAIHAVVVLADGAEASADVLLAHATERLAAFKKPRSLEFVDALPVNANGKVLKRELRARHRGTPA